MHFLIANKYRFLHFYIATYLHLKRLRMNLQDFIKEQRDKAAQEGKGDPQIEIFYNQLVDGLKEKIADAPFQTSFSHSICLEPGHGLEQDYIERELARLAVKNEENIKFYITLNDSNLRFYIAATCEG